MNFNTLIYIAILVNFSNYWNFREGEGNDSRPAEIKTGFLEGKDIKDMTPTE